MKTMCLLALVLALDAVLTDRTILLEPHTAALVGKDAIDKMHRVSSRSATGAGRSSTAR